LMRHGRFLAPFPVGLLTSAMGLSTNLCKRFPLFCLPRLRTMPAPRRRLAAGAPYAARAASRRPG
jgi:hypothetical protein